MALAFAFLSGFLVALSLAEWARGDLPAMRANLLLAIVGAILTGVSLL